MTGESVKRMRAVRIHELVGPSGLRVDEVPEPQAGPGEVLIDVRAAGVNFPELLLSHGKYQFKPEPPFIPGGEAAGVVRSVGAGVTSLAPGDRVAATMLNGGYAEAIAVPEITAVKFADGVSFEVAAATLLTYATTYHALVDRAALRAGETLLVLGAAGGVGIAAVERLQYVLEMASEQLREFRQLILVGAPAPVAYFAYPGKNSVVTSSECEIYKLASPGQHCAGTR